jgi:transposase
MTSVIIDREIGDWRRFNNRRQIASYTGLCPGEYSSGNTRLQSCVTKHGNPRLRAALVELAWRLVRFQPNYKPVLKWRQILAKRCASHRSCPQKSHRGCGTPVGRRSVARAHRTLQPAGSRS